MQPSHTLFLNPGSHPVQLPHPEAQTLGAALAQAASVCAESESRAKGGSSTGRPLLKNITGTVQHSHSDMPGRGSWVLLGGGKGGVYHLCYGSYHSYG